MEQQKFCVSDEENCLPLTPTVVERDYDGPRFDGEITCEFMRELLLWFKEQKKLHKKFAYKIILGVKRIFSSLPSLVDVTIPEVCEQGMVV